MEKHSFDIVSLNQNFIGKRFAQIWKKVKHHWLIYKSKNEKESIAVVEDSVELLTFETFSMALLVPGCTKTMCRELFVK